MPVDAAACRDLVQVYPSESGAVPALRGVDAHFATGSITVITGPSGAGKSTLLRLLACLEHPTAGDVWIARQQTGTMRKRVRRDLVARHIGYVFQRPRDNLLDYLTASEHLALALQMRVGHRPSGIECRDMLASFGLDDITSRRPDDIAAGSQQLLAFAMATIGAPAIVVGDEPSAELDADATGRLVALLRTSSGAGRTFVLATHDPSIMAIADQHIEVRRGLVTDLTLPGRPEHDDAAEQW
jgi:putative ABC transport system ATP-binding protein